MRVLLAGLFHETHCFVPDRTPLSDFSVARGDELLGFRGNGSMIDGFLEVAAAESWQVVPAVSFMATPSGIVEDRVVESFLADFDAVATESECDAVFLALHGAMVSESVEDVEGLLLSRLRAVPSLARVPVVGVFDLHATLTPAMAAGADALVCYRENPHVDARESAVRAAGLLARIGAEGRRPRMHYRHAGVIWPPTGTGTADTPMRDLEALARKIEAEDPEIRAVNVVAGFSFADVADAGVSFSVVTTGSAGRAEAALARLADAAMELRDAGLPAEMTPAAAISAAARATGSGPALWWSRPTTSAAAPRATAPSCSGRCSPPGIRMPASSWPMPRRWPRSPIRRPGRVAGCGSAAGITRWIRVRWSSRWNSSPGVTVVSPSRTGRATRQPPPASGWTWARPRWCAMPASPSC